MKPGSPERHPSTLWMITKEPVLNDFVSYLSECKDRLQADPGSLQTIEFSRRQIEEVKEAFARMIRRGEEKLHRFCSILADELFTGPYRLRSVVIGRCAAEPDPFTLSQPIEPADIYSRTDLDLGNWLLSNVRMKNRSNEWLQPSLVANFVEYQPLQVNDLKLVKMVSRIKAEEEVWAKTVDEIFSLDRLVKKDKELRALSFYIKDVFGIKLIVSGPDDVERALCRLSESSWTTQQLAKHRVPGVRSAKQPRLIELKNHLGEDMQKKSGWQALKAVISWWDKTFEVQIQSLDVYFREQEYLTSESHAGFKERRERLRKMVAERLPLFGFYLEMLHWLFIFPESDPPRLENLQINMRP